jgi:membrane protease YdiL (CAAX protease family)
MTPAEWRHAAGLLLLGALFYAGIAAIVVVLVRRKLVPPAERVRIREGLCALPWQPSDALVMLAIYLAVQIATLTVGLILTQLSGVSAARLALLTYGLQALLFPAAGLVALTALAGVRGITWSRWLRPIRRQSAARTVPQALLFYLAMMPFVSYGGELARSLLSRFDFPVSAQPVVELIIDPANPGWLRWPLIVLAVTLVPAVEESIFRGILLPLALQRAPVWQAVFAVSALFAALHFHLASFVPLGIVAAAFSLGYLRTGSLLVPILMHACFNTVSLVALFLLRGAPGLMPV